MNELEKLITQRLTQSSLLNRGQAGAEAGEEFSGEEFSGKELFGAQV